MFVPYSVDVPMERIPITNWVLIGVTSVISLVILGGTLNQSFRRDVDFDRRMMEEDDDEPRFPLALDPERFSFVQLFSYQFVHGNLLHLIGNMIFLFVFGNAINAKLGHAAFIVCYLLLGAMGGVGWLIFGNGLPMVGASGAIMGIIGIFLILYPKNDVTILVLWRGGGNSFDVSAYWVIGTYLVLDLIGTLREGQGIAYVAHLFGEIFGMAAGVGFVLCGFVRSTRYEQNLLEMFGWKQPKKKKKKKRRPAEDEEDDEE